MFNTSVNIADIGEVHFKTSKRAKRFNIRIKPFDGVFVSVPLGVNLEKAIGLVKKKKAWIIKSKDKVAAVEQRQTVFTEQSNYTTKYHRLKLKADRQAKQITANISNRVINITYPPTTVVKAPAFQSFIKEVLTDVLRHEAKYYLPKRLHDLATEKQFSYNKVFIKNIKSRWGSCSHVNNINLSLHLMRLPDELIDYVLLHELTHTKVKDHSPNFWQQLSNSCPNALSLDKQLKNYSTTIW